MKQNINIKLLALYMLVIIAAAYFMPREPNWTPSFSSRHHWPFGTKILHGELSRIFQDASITTGNKTLYEMQDSLEDFRGNMIFIQEAMTLDTLDLHILMDMLENGNNVLLAAREFPPALLDTLHLTTDYEMLASEVMTAGMQGEKVGHQFFGDQERQDSSYDFTLSGYYLYFSEKDSVKQSSGLAWAGDSSHVNMLSQRFGKGRLFMHTNPYLFTNYYLLSNDGREYLSHIFSYLPDGDIYWDEYYNGHGDLRQRHMLDVLLARPSLRWAFNLTILTILLFLLFMSKRKQRIIPSLDPYTNDSRELVETIGDLYYNASTNKRMATRKIRLMENMIVRSIGDVEDIGKERILKKIHLKTGLPIPEINKTYTLIRNIEKQEVVSDRQLDVLNKRINEIIDLI